MSARRESSPPRKTQAWRIGTPVVMLLGGALFVISAQNSDGVDLRPQKYTDIASIVEDESEELTELNDRAAELEAQVESLTQAVGDRTVNRYNREIETIEDPAGFTPRSGAAVTVVLTDAPEELISTSTRDLNELVVHQQDIQAVVNAMWRGGAEAVTIQGQRVISTTGIKCSGNTVRLQGIPYSPPYVITAIGDQAAIATELQEDDYLELYRSAAQNPEINVGWEQTLQEFATAPAYDGVVNLNYAVPLKS